MSSRTEKERQKAQQEKFQAILSGLLKDEDNKYCVDCDAKGPRWASWNLGVFLCIRCAGIHRNLGVHISKVKSVNLDTWLPDQIAMMMEMGNSRARAVYEANIPDNYKRPQTNSGLETFIRAKYESKKYIAREWVPPKPAIPKELLEDDKDKKKSRPKVTATSGAIQLNAAPRSQSNTSSTTSSQASKPQSKPAPTSQPKPVEAQPKAPPPSSNTADLIGLEAPAAAQPSANNLLGDLNDFMGSGPTSNTMGNVENQGMSNGQVSNGSIEANLFGDNPATLGPETQTKSSKDSIMALFSSGGQQPQQFGVPGPNYMYMTPSEVSPMYMYADPGGMYVPAQQNMAAMYGMQHQQQPMMSVPGNMPMQQPGMYGNQMGMGMGMQQPGMQGMQPAGMGMQQPAGMGMYGQQAQMQQMQFQQMQNQMAGMQIGQGGMMAQNGVPAGQGWGGANTGHTLKSNLWH